MIFCCNSGLIKCGMGDYFGACGVVGIVNCAGKTTSLEHYGDLLSVKDLSGLFGVSVQTIYKEIRDGKFGKPLKFGRVYRVPKIYIYERYFKGYEGENLAIN